MPSSLSSLTCCHITHPIHRNEIIFYFLFLDQLSEGSVFIIDNAYVHSDYFKNQRSSISTECNVCVILSSIFGRFLSKLVLIMILRNSGEMLSPEKENQIYQDLFVEENEELKELNLLSSGDDSVVNSLSINSLSLKDFPLNRKLNADGENNENDTLDNKTVFKIVKILPLNKSNSELMTEKFIQNNSCSDSELSLTQNHGSRVELISTLSSGYVKLINTLSKVSLTCLKNISVAIPAGTQVDTRGEYEYFHILCFAFFSMFSFIGHYFSPFLILFICVYFLNDFHVMNSLVFYSFIY